MHSDERLVFLIQHWPVNIVAVRVRPVEHYAGYTPFGTGLHNIVQRGDICIETASHILQVEDDSVDVFHLLGRGLLVLAVERHDRQTRMLVDTTVHPRSSLGIAAESVLWTEDSGYIEIAIDKRVHQVLVAYPRRLVGDDGDALTARNLTGYSIGTFTLPQHVGTNP